MEKQVKVIVSKKEPQNKHVLWLEQNSLYGIFPKLFNNGEWQNLKTVPEKILNKVNKLEEKVAEMEVTVEQQILALEINNSSGDIITITGEDSSYTNIAVNPLTGEITMEIEY